MSQNQTFREKYLNRHMALELFPAVLFFFANYGWGLMVATAVVMIAVIIATAAGLYWERRVPVLAVVTLVMVLILGGAGLIFQNETYIKIKPTVGKCLFAATLVIGLFFKPSFLARALSSLLSLTDRGWIVLTWSWVAYALSLAILNEIVWRNMDTDNWVAVKTALIPIKLLGYVLITRILAPRYWQVVN